MINYTITNIFIFFIITIIIFYIYIRVKFRFWSIQPVFHFYDFYYWIKNVGIIKKELPEKNRYTNFKNISFISFEKMISNKITFNKKIKEFTFLIQNHYLKNKEHEFHFNPKEENIIPYFKNHFADCYFSFYYKDILLEDLNNKDFIPDKKLIGVMTSRPLHVFIKGKLLDVYYVDYLCVDKFHRNKNIAPQIIQTHEYLQSHSNKKIAVSLFKREEKITGIVPICIYNTLCFNMKKWTIPLKLSINFNLLIGDSSNLFYLYNFINENKKKWDMYILPEISNLIELVKTKNLFIFMVMNEKEIMSVYFFRKVCTSISNEKEVLSCFASIKGENKIVNNELFILGFKNSIYSIVKHYTNFHYLNIENISDNNIIINNLLIKTFPMSTFPTAYFFYNFAYQTFSANKVLIIN